MKLGNYLVSETGVYSYTTSANPICVACKPGFKPTLNNSKNYAINNCTEIKNCANSNSFNTCELCKFGYALDIDSNGESCV